MSMGSDRKHIKLAYQLDSSWGIQFNLMMDKVLGLNSGKHREREGGGAGKRGGREERGGEEGE